MDIGPWIVAGAALLQPWIIALCKRLFPADVRLYETGNLQVGYGSFGPSLGIAGTIATHRKDVFIKEMHCVVRNRSDGSTHNFPWKAFRGNELLPRQERLELAGGFLLSTTNPFRFNIFFADERFIGEIGSKVKDAPRKWQEFKDAKAKESSQQLSENRVPVGNSSVDTMFAEFSRNGGMLEEFKAFDHAFYWKPDVYEIELVAQSIKPFKEYRLSRVFKLSEDDSKLLRLNTIQLCKSSFGMKANFVFAYPRYMKPEQTP